MFSSEEIDNVFVCINRVLVAEVVYSAFTYKSMRRKSANPATWMFQTASVLASLFK